MLESETILKALAHIRKRPHMVFSGDAPSVATFLDGFKLACMLLYPALDYDLVYGEIAEKHGWKTASSSAIWLQMREHGYNDERLIAELIELHLKVWGTLEKQPLEIETQGLGK